MFKNIKDVPSCLEQDNILSTTENDYCYIFSLLLTNYKLDINEEDLYNLNKIKNIDTIDYSNLDKNIYVKYIFFNEDKNKYAFTQTIKNVLTILKKYIKEDNNNLGYVSCIDDNDIGTYKLGKYDEFIESLEKDL
jgi:predicted RNA-binding protein with PUA domain